MKNIISLSLVFLLSCSQVPVKKDEGPLNELEAMLSPEDLRIHRCLNSGKEINLDLKKECLTGTQYESHISRMPSDDGDSDFVMKNNWFFGDNSKLDNFYKLSQGFVKATGKFLKHATNDRGVGVDGNAFFGVGAGWLAEIVNHHGKVGLFCAPYVMATTDIGVTASISVVQSISCPSNQAYEGGFLQIGASISGEAIGLPVDLGAAYSFGLDLPGFSQKVKTARAAGKLSVRALMAEVGRLNDAQIKRGIASNNGRAAMMNIALRPLGVLGIRTPSMSSIRSVNNAIKDALLHHRSLGIQFKQYYNSYLSRYLVSNNLPMLNQFFSILTSSMSGCDSVGGSAALSLTLSPVELSVQYQNYSLLNEMAFEDLGVLKVITPMGLMNPFLMQPSNLRTVVRVARGILAIPTKVSRQCTRVFPRI